MKTKGRALSAPLSVVEILVLEAIQRELRALDGLASKQALTAFRVGKLNSHVFHLEIRAVRSQGSKHNSLLVEALYDLLKDLVLGVNSIIPSSPFQRPPNGFPISFVAPKLNIDLVGSLSTNIRDFQPDLIPSVIIRH
jgi:hypothetical protein